MRRGLVAAAAVGALAVAAGAAVAVSGVWDDGGAEPAGTGLPPATATVTRQTLVDTREKTGELGYGAQATVAARIAGTLTALPEPGDVIGRGEALAGVDGAPIVLMYGKVPAYRDLVPGLGGEDVGQFEKNLAKLGYGGFTVDDAYTAATASAVADWQDDLGLDATGTVRLGRVFFAAGEVRVAALGGDLGDAVAPGADLVAYTGTERLVTVDLDLDEAGIAAEDDEVEVRLPDGTVTAGTVEDTTTVIRPASENREATTVEEVTVAVADAGALDDLDRASVKVAFHVGRREDVLTVPVSALLALGDGGYGVQVVANGSTRILPVETGLFAGGRVEVSGDGLTEGMTVGVPS